MAINYTKMHGLKNDFIIIDGREKKILLNSKKIKKISDRKKGLGCDQVVIFEKPKKKNALAFVKFYNSDGSKTKACGNAARCAAFLLMKEFKKKKIIFQTEAALLNASLTKNNQVSVDIGKAYFRWKQIPLKRKTDINKIDFKIDSFSNPFVVNVGNPHIVFFVEDCFKYDLKKIGPLIENHKLFPEKINVTFAERKSANNISVNVWERGAGLTKACGTAACATGVVAFEKSLTGKSTNIHFKEGFLNIEYDINISMTGPVSDIKEIQIKL